MLIKSVKPWKWSVFSFWIIDVKLSCFEKSLQKLFQSKKNTTLTLKVNEIPKSDPANSIFLSTWAELVSKLSFPAVGQMFNVDVHKTNEFTD